MHNTIKRLYKPNVPSRAVNLTVAAESAPPQSAVCEVTEYDSVTGMEQWNDSVFLQDFEDSVITVPAPLFAESKPANQKSFDMLDPFANVGKNSA